MLVGDEVEIGVRLIVGCLPFEGSIQLTDEQVGRAAVEHQMVDIHQQVDIIVGLHNLKTIERSLLQVKWSNKLVLVCIQLFLLHHAERNLHGNAVLGGLHDGVALGGEVNAEFGMLTNYLFNTFSQFFGIGVGGVGEQVGDVVDG